MVSYLDALTERQIGLLIAFPVFIFIAIILGLLILRRDSRYWGNRLFFIAFVFNALALLFNLLYLFSTESPVSSSLNITSITCINCGLCSMILAILVLYKGENEVIGNKNTYIFLLITSVVIIIQVLLPAGVGVVNVAGELVPQWSLYFGLYQIVFGLIYFILLLSYAIQLYREISPEMQKKFKRFLIGGVFVYLTMLSVSINNMRIIPGYEEIAAIFNLGAFIGIILIYYGIVRRD